VLEEKHLLFRGQIRLLESNPPLEEKGGIGDGGHRGRTSDISIVVDQG